MDSPPARRTAAIASNAATFAVAALGSAALLLAFFALVLQHPSSLPSLFSSRLQSLRTVGFQPFGDPKTAKLRVRGSAYAVVLPEICKWYPHKWGDGNREKMLALLDGAHHFLEDIGVEYSLYRGTALGLMRHGGHLIPWDDDVDLYIRPNDTSKVIASIKEHPYFCTESFWGGPKIFYCHNPPIRNKKHSYPFIDLFNTTERSNGANEFFLPSGLGTFEGITVRVPNDAKEGLNKLYGKKWATECVSASWDHVLERESSLRGKNVSCVELQEQCGSSWPLQSAIQIGA